MTGESTGSNEIVGLSVTISKGFIYGAAVKFTPNSGKPYIQSKNISFWLENCDVSVASIAFSKTIAETNYNIGESSKTTTAYETNIASECADHVIYTYVV